MKSLDRAIRKLDTASWMSPKAIEREIDNLVNGSTANLPESQLKSKVRHLTQMIDKLADMGYFDDVDKLDAKLRNACYRRGVKY